MSANDAAAARIDKVVLLGRDESLWLAANALHAAFHAAGVEIAVVELPSLHRPGDVLSTFKSQEAFHRLLGLKEAELLQMTAGTYSLGQRFANWSKTQPPFMHAYSTYGIKFQRLPFLQYWLKARRNGMKAEFEDFAIGAVAAKTGKFFIPGGEIDGFAICDYAYHLDARAYNQVLKQLALRRGVTVKEGRLAEAIRDPQSGDIVRLALTNGQSVEGDFFIDASGSESLLLGQALGEGFESWSGYFPNDRILTTAAPPFNTIPSYSQIAAFRSGWVGLYPMRDKVSVQQAYSSVDISDQEALEAAGLVSGLRLDGRATVSPIEAGRRSRFWVRNCLAIGEAAVVLEPLDNIPMHVNLIGISHLIGLFPVDRSNMIECREYNTTVTRVYERIRDFQMTHYKLNQRYDQPLWDHCRSMPVPDALAYKLDFFSRRGHLVQYEDETFEEASWTAILIGHGLIPEAYDPLVDEVPDDEAIRNFQKILGFIKHNVEPMKPQEDYLREANRRAGVPGL
jgi:tryptophan halogenase